MPLADIIMLILNMHHTVRSLNDQQKLLFFFRFIFCHILKLSKFSFLFIYLISVNVPNRTSLVAQTVKASAYNVGEPGSIPASGRSPGEGNGNPLQYSGLENPMDRGAWWATVAKGRT